MKTDARGSARGFRQLDRRGLSLLVVLLVVPAIALAVGRSVPALDPILQSPVFHLYVVSAIAACALFVALATATYAVRDGRAAPVLTAIGCVAVGFMMLGHGLTTPGIFGRPMNLWVARLPVLALATFAVCLTAASRPHATISRLVARSPRVALGFPMASIALASAAIAIDPTVLSGAAPVPGETLDPHRAPRHERGPVAGGRRGALATVAARQGSDRTRAGPGELADDVGDPVVRVRAVLAIVLVGLPRLPPGGLRRGGLGRRRRLSRLANPGRSRGRDHHERPDGPGRTQPARCPPRADRRRRGQGPVHARTLRPGGRPLDQDRPAPGSRTGRRPWPAPGCVPARRREDQHPRPGPEQARAISIRRSGNRYSGTPRSGGTS